MALIKEMKFINGMVANYHRISQIHKNVDNIFVLVKSYVDKDARESEEYWIDIYTQYNKAVETGDEQEAERIRNSISPDLMRTMLDRDGDLSIYNTPINLSYSEDLDHDASMDSIYQALTKTPPFDGAVPDNDA